MVRVLVAGVIAFLCSLGFGLWNSDPYAGASGEVAARFDLMRGEYRILTYGLPASERPAFAQVLREQYGVELRVVAGCAVSDSLFRYVEGYNAVSRAAIERKFGYDVEDRAWKSVMRTN